MAHSGGQLEAGWQDFAKVLDLDQFGWIWRGKDQAEQLDVGGGKAAALGHGKTHLVVIKAVLLPWLQRLVSAVCPKAGLVAGLAQKLGVEPEFQQAGV